MEQQAQSEQRELEVPELLLAELEVPHLLHGLAKMDPTERLAQQETRDLLVLELLLVVLVE